MKAKHTVVISLVAVVLLALAAVGVIYYIRHKDGFLGLRSFVAGRGPLEGETLEAPTYGIDAHWGNVAYPFGRIPARPV